MKKLTKSANDKMISGVLGGVAEYFDVDSTFVRLAYVLFSILGSGSPFLVYILLAIIIPDAE
ncbi:PspC domain-containing protein [Allofustis seminis]|uniref:PspC domain-containing protein n=1 Tax=Allofustis seminis TaxID=166939 RepID=UPI00037F0E8E|nr:PspC domain-containing protein [Allofustis seminis]